MSTLDERKVEPTVGAKKWIAPTVSKYMGRSSTHKPITEESRKKVLEIRKGILDNPITLNEDREPWEKQSAEPHKYYKLFQVWLDLAEERLDRSILETHNRTGVGRKFLIALSKLWRWDERAAAYDHYSAKLKYQAKLRVIEEMAERQARRGLITASIGLQVILELRRRIKAGKLKGATLKELRSMTRPALMAIRLGQEEERYARGVSKAIITPNSRLIDPTDESQQVKNVMEAVLSLKPTPELDAAIDSLESVIQSALAASQRQREAIKPVSGLLSSPDTVEGDFKELK